METLNKTENGNILYTKSILNRVRKQTVLVAAKRLQAQLGESFDLTEYTKPELISYILYKQDYLW